MTDSLEQTAQDAFNRGMFDAITEKLSVEKFYDTLLLQKYFSGFATGIAEKNKVPESEKKLFVLQFARGMSDANAGHRPAVFGGAYLQGYELTKPHHVREQDSELDHINEIRWEYDLPPISREDLIEE